MLGAFMRQGGELAKPEQGFKGEFVRNILEVKKECQSDESEARS